MIIGFDAKRAFFNTSGLGNYSRTLVKSLSAYFPDNQYFLFTPPINDSSLKNFFIKAQNTSIVCPENFLTKNFPFIWRSFQISNFINKNNIRIYHGLSNELPFTGKKIKAKKIVTIHDLIFLRYPELYPFFDRKIYSLKFRKACEQADMIVAISEQTKHDIIDFFHIPGEKIKTVYQGCNPVFYALRDVKELEEIKKKYTLPSSYLLYVGTIEERKNLLTIIKALRGLGNDLPLVVVGKKRKYAGLVENYIHTHRLEHRVVFLEQVATDDLPCIYQAAEIFIYPSVFEGFGLPVVEALFSKVPVITSKGSCFAEAGGAHTVYISPDDEAELIFHIERILGPSEVKKMMTEKGREYARIFEVKNTAAEMMKLYGKVQSM